MDRSRIRILLVEDNRGDARLIRELLLDAGVPAGGLAYASRLEDALALLRASTFDIVLLDLALADAQGLDGLLRVRGAAPDVPVLVLTGLDDEAVALRALKSGAQDYLVKGQVDGKTLGRALRYGVQRKRAEIRAAFLAEAARVLSSALDYSTTLRAVAQMAVGRVADWCVVYLEEEGVIRRLEAAHADQASLHSAAEVLARPVAPGTPHPVHAVLASGEPRLFATLGPAFVDSVADGEADRAVVRGMGLTSAIYAPMVVHGQTLGALGLFRAGGQPYDEDDLVLAQELGHLAAAAVDNARLYDRATRATRLRDEVLGFVTHDLRNPLSAIQMLAELLSEPELSADDRLRHVDRIVRSAEQMDRLIQDLLDVSAAESGRLTLSPAPLEPAGFAREAAEMLGPVARARGVDLRVDVPEGLSVVEADPDRLLRVVANLLENAMKHTPPGGEVTLSADSDADGVRFAVTDRGPGIATEHLERVFDRFWQASRTRRGGAGLGLAISRGIVEAHGGRIWVESEPGAGSTFYFTLPRTGAEVAETRP
jgi:signal transduction histidine kinase/DNA-binding NarL/FixJ family response regulator